MFEYVTSIIRHNLKDPNTAEYVSSVCGTCESEKLTCRIDFNDTSPLWF